MVFDMSLNETSNFKNSTLTVVWPPGLFSPVHRQEWLIWIAMIGATSVFGVLANLLLLIASLTVQTIRQVSSSPLIIHCTILDLYISAVAAPLGSVLGYLGPAYNRYLPPQFCRFFGLAFFSAYGLHAWAACLMAFQRLVATCFPYSYAKFKTKKATAFMVILPWIIVMTINLLNVLEIGSKTTVSNYTGGCTTLPAGEGGSTMLYHSFSVYVPSALMGAMYIVIIVRTAYDLSIKTMVHKTGGAAESNTTSVIKRRFKISKMLFISFVWFCVSMYPLPIIIAYYPREFNQSIEIHLAVRYLVASYSCFNPIIYVASSRLYYIGIKQLLTCSPFQEKKVRPSQLPDIMRIARGSSQSSTQRPI